MFKSYFIQISSVSPNIKILLQVSIQGTISHLVILSPESSSRPWQFSQAFLVSDDFDNFEQYQSLSFRKSL